MIKKQKISYILPIIIALLFSTLAFAEDATLYTNTGENSDGTVYGGAGDPNQTPPIYIPNPPVKDIKPVPMPPIRVNDTKAKVEIKATLDARRDEIETNRKANQDALLKLRLDTKAKVESGEIKPADAMKQVQDQIKLLRQSALDEAKNSREAFKKNLADDRVDMKTAFDQKRTDLIASIQARRDAFKQELENNKEEAQNKREEMKDKFQEGLNKIKDENRKLSVEEIQAKIVEMNNKAVDHMTENINKIESVLVSLESRTDKAEANGVNVASVRTAITSAETAIVSARAAITVQAGKTYTVTINSDTTAKSDVGVTFKALRADIKVAQDSVKVAHEAVRKALTTLVKIPKVDELSVEASTDSTTEVDGTNN